MQKLWIGRDTVKFLISFLLVMVVATLAGCGAGGSGTGVGGAPAASGVIATAAPSLKLALYDSTGTAVTSTSTASPATVKATLTDAAGAAVTSTVVTFSTDATLATMNPTAGTALTNSSGVASITLSPANLTAAGAATITATAQVGTTAVTNSTGFSIGSSTVTVSTPVFGVGVGSLSAFATTSVTVTVSSGGVPVTTQQTVTFTSGCAASGKAVLGSALTVNGVAIGSYRDNGCAGTDTITASVNGGLASSSATLTVLAPVTGSIQYVSANPINISLKGSGGAPTSQVTFKVVDSGGNPISGKTVILGLSTNVGGLALASNSGISDANGLVVATVNSGTVSTPVRVTASTPGAVAGTTLTTQSSQLSITTGIPDQVGFSLSATQHNIEGWTIDGTTTVLTARLADHFKNPVPDGTTVNFTAEAGSIVGTCNTIAGACSATYSSQGIRPSSTNNGFGRVTVLAYAVGEESFIDLNFNGVADLVTTEVSPTNPTGNEMFDVNGVSTDLPDAWVDYNENGVHDAGEPFYNINGNTTYTAADGKYSGVLCDNVTPPPVGSSPGTCSPFKTQYVRASNVIVLSSSQANITVNGNAPIALPTCTPGATGGPGIPLTFNVKVVDLNGNAMPVGTTVQFSNSNGTLVSSSSYLVPDTSGCLSTAAGCPASVGTASFGDISVTMKSSATWASTSPWACTPDTNGSTGTFTVTVTSPKGTVTKANATITD